MTPTPEQLQSLIDKDAIRDVLYRYCRGVDRRDWELLRSVYFDDAFEDHGPVGRCSAPEFVDIMKKRVELGKRTISQHVISNILIDLDGNRARVESYFRATVGGDSPDLLTAGGRYIDQFERRNGEWRISHRIAMVEWSHVTELLGGGGGGVTGALDQYYESRHDLEDLIYQAELPLRSRFIPEF